VSLSDLWQTLVGGTVLAAVFAGIASYIAAKEHGAHPHSLKGEMKGRYSIRVNEQYRVTFRWENGHAFEVAVEDYH